LNGLLQATPCTPPAKKTTIGAPPGPTICATAHLAVTLLPSAGKLYY
jgi:hypothetical protein